MPKVRRDKRKLASQLSHISHLTPMDESEHTLAELELQMGRLRALRSDRLATAQAMIARANAEFDRDALPLGRKITALRAKVEAASRPKASKAPTRRNGTPHDPEWSQSEIDHYYELVQRGG